VGLPVFAPTSILMFGSATIPNRALPVEHLAGRYEGTALPAA
jgi:hypothetical protein